MTPLLNINEDFLRRFTVEGVRANDGTVVDATGLALQLRIAATRTGPEIGSLTTDAAEYVDTPGFYHAGFDTAALVTDLTDFVGKLVYVIVSKTGDLDCVWWLYRVATNRQLS
jgi:hypothetical protein